MDLEHSAKVCVLKAYSSLRVLLVVEDPLGSRHGGEVSSQRWRGGGGAYEEATALAPSPAHFWPQAENQLPFTKRPAMLGRLTLVQRAGD